jgi:prostaglandin-endoperoxide synthase 2
MPNWFEREIIAHLADAVDADNWLSVEASHLMIDTAVNTTRNRPHPWSTFADYPNWRSLSDRTFLARHLPPKYPDPANPLPDPTAITPLFTRPAGGGGRKSNKSTCLFPAFAQYLTDGFIRTNPTDAKRNTSNHEIDMCPLYGRTPDQTEALRQHGQTAGQKGRLKSQRIGSEEFPPFLYHADGTLTDPAFNVLDPPLFAFNQPLKDPAAPAPPPPADWEPARKASLFAVGGDRVNSSVFTAMMNTVWLREHNRVAGELERRNPTWDDERVFQTARNIVIPMFIKIVVEDYINHITPLPLKIKADPAVAWDATWNRPNWMTAEFSLLYRWHSLMPDAIAWPGGAIPLAGFTLDNRPLLAAGLDGAITAAATQPTNELGAFNTAAELLQIEWLSVVQARGNHLDCYNAYREAFGMPAAATFGDISSDPQVQALLEQLYGTPDRVEFYPGLFAEDRVPDSPLPKLLMTMVAVDAFSQALTNPLLSQHVWKDNPTLTFTDWGFAEIGATSTLADVLARQGRPGTAPPASLTIPGWRYVTDI